MTIHDCLHHRTRLRPVPLPAGDDLLFAASGAYCALTYDGSRRVEGCRNENRNQFRVLLLPLFGALASCGGGGGGGGSGSRRMAATGMAARACSCPRANFDAMCVNPRPGTADRSGTRTDENNWLRSWTNELYLWYGEVTDRDPVATTTTDHYFELLKTDAITPSGQAKDKFHFTYDTDAWIALSQGGIEAGLRRRVRHARAHAAAPHRGGLHRGRIAGGDAARARRRNPAGRRRGCGQRQHPGHCRRAERGTVSRTPPARATPSWCATPPASSAP